jgi:hypothetical protein
MTLYRFIKESVIFITLSVMISCLTPIDFPADIGKGRIAISGQVSTISDRNIVTIGRTADTQRLPFPVEGASVMLVDELGRFFYYYENPDNPGDYLLDGFTAEPGLKYHLIATLQEGEVYRSSPERVPMMSGSVSTTHEIVSEIATDAEGTNAEKSFLKIYAKSLLPASSEDTYLKWNVEEVFAIVPTDFPDPFGYTPPNCYVYQNADPQYFALFNGANVEKTSFDKNLIASREIDNTFFDRHYYTTYQSATTKEAYEYWHKVNVLANQVGSIFDSPPAEITGNIVNVNKSAEKVNGYFQAVNQSYDRFFILPGDLPFPLLMPSCVYDNRDLDRYPARCLQCIEVRNSSFNRPSWF